MKWDPSLEFFLKCSYQDITWQLKSFSESTFPLNFIECKMQRLEQISLGYAVESSQDLAVKKSFAEAWERLCFSNIYSENNLEFRNTSGFAAGDSLAMASKNAKEELIERAVFLTAWQSQSGWRKVNFSKLKTRYLKFALSLKGWKLDLYDLKSSEGIVKCLVARHKDRGLVFDSAFCENSFSTELKLLNSVLKNIFLPSVNPINKLTENSRPIDHAKFYASPEHLKSLDFLSLDLNAGVVFKLENPELLETNVIYDEEDFPTVVACSHPTWPKISWGTNSIQGKNPWPHPLA